MGKEEGLTFIPFFALTLKENFRLSDENFLHISELIGWGNKCSTRRYLFDDKSTSTICGKLSFWLHFVLIKITLMLCLLVWMVMIWPFSGNHRPILLIILTTMDCVQLLLIPNLDPDSAWTSFIPFGLLWNIFGCLFPTPLIFEIQIHIYEIAAIKFLNSDIQRVRRFYSGPSEKNV